MKALGKILISMSLIMCVLALSSCAQFWCWSQECKQEQEEEKDKLTEAKLNLIESREESQTIVRRIKTKCTDEFFNTKAGARDEYNDIRGEYDKLSSASNALILVLSLSIKDNDNVQKSSSFKQKAKESADLATKFINRAEPFSYACQVSPPAAPGMRPPPPPPVPVSGPAVILAEVLIKSGFIIWDEYKKQDEQQREKTADNLKAEFKWTSWDDLK